MKDITDILYLFNVKLSKNSRFWEFTKINSVLRFVIRLIANNILPVYYKYSKKRDIQNTVPIIVSMTSFPARIQKVWITIESMLRQENAPEKIILWLSRNQFQKELEDLPSELVEQQSRGLTIRFVDGDIRSHKKYYFAFKEFPDKYILTIDDDLLFPSTFVEDTYQCALRHPKSIIAHFGSVFQWKSDIDYFEKIHRRVEPEETGRHLFFGSGGGTLFPPNKLAPIMDNIDDITGLCPTADDIYLNALSRIAGCEITFRGIFPLLSVNNKNDQKLTDHNGNLFDPESVNAKQLRTLVSHVRDKWGYNPFEINSLD